MDTIRAVAGAVAEKRFGEVDELEELATQRINVG